MIQNDQFTVYIPEKFDRNKILSLCKELNTYLAANQVKPGKLLDVESPLGMYLNFRQEFLIKDFMEINQLKWVNKNKIIYAVEPLQDESNQKRRVEVKEEQEKSDLYKYLDSNLIAADTLLPNNSVTQSLPTPRV